MINDYEIGMNFIMKLSGQIYPGQWNIFGTSKNVLSMQTYRENKIKDLYMFRNSHNNCFSWEID